MNLEEPDGRQYLFAIDDQHLKKISGTKLTSKCQRNVSSNACQHSDNFGFSQENWQDEKT